jgi:hypothetical protein
VRLELNEVRMTFDGGAEHAGRAERISRLAFDYLSGMLADWRGGPLAVAEIGRLEVRPIAVTLDSMSDEEAARSAASEIYRALLGALKPVRS